MTDTHIRFATEEDVPVILHLIKGLAEYEKGLDQVETTEAILYDSLFVQKAAETLLLDVDGVGVVGMALFFRNFSTWTGRPGIWLEDLYIEPEYRGNGRGRMLMAALAKVCVERGWQRLEWTCLKWNTPSLGFYQSIGAEAMDDWLNHRLAGDALSALAAQSEGESR